MSIRAPPPEISSTTFAAVSSLSWSGISSPLTFRQPRDQIADSGIDPGFDRRAILALKLRDNVIHHSLGFTSNPAGHLSEGIVPMPTPKDLLIDRQDQTTERYLGCKQRIRSAVNDHICIEQTT